MVDTNVLASVLDESGEYTPFASAMKEQYPELTDNEMAHLHYFGGLTPNDPKYEAHRLALRDKFGSIGLAQLERATTLFTTSADADALLPAGAATIELPEDEDDDEGNALIGAVGAVANDIRSLAPTQGNDLVEGIGAGVMEASSSGDNLIRQAATGFRNLFTPEGRRGKSYSFDAPSNEEIEWLRERSKGKVGIFGGPGSGMSMDVDADGNPTKVRAVISESDLSEFRDTFRPDYEAPMTTSEELDAAAEAAMEKLDSVSGGLVAGVTEFAALSVATGGGLGTTGAKAVGIAIAKPAVIDQIIYEEDEALAVQAVIEMTGNTAPLWMSATEDSPLMNRTKLLGESVLFGTLGEGLIAGVKAAANGNMAKAAEIADEQRSAVIKAKADALGEFAESIDQVDLGYQSPRNVVEATAPKTPETAPESGSVAPEVVPSFNNQISTRVRAAFSEADTSATAAQARIAAGEGIVGDIKAETLDALTYTEGFIKTIGMDDIGDATASVKKSMVDSFNRSRTTFKDAQRLAVATQKKLKEEFGENLPSEMLVKLDTGDAIADFNLRVAYLKGGEKKLDTLKAYLLGETDDATMRSMMEEVGESWIYDVPEANRPAVVAEIINELRADMAAVTAKQKSAVREGAQLLRAAREIRTDKGKDAIKKILEAQAKRGEITPAELGRRLEALELGSQKKFGAAKYDDGNNLFDDALLYGQGNMLLSVNVWSLNMVVEPLRLAYLGAVGGFYRAMDQARRGNWKEAGRIARKGARFFEAGKQFRRGAAGFAKVWRTSQANLSNSADALGMASREMQAAKSLKEIWSDTNKIAGVIPSLGLRAGMRVLGSASYRIIAGISEFSTQVFYHHNVELDALTGLYGKRWQDLRKKQGYLTDEQMSLMLMSKRAEGELATIDGRSYDRAYITLAAESGFRNKEQGVVRGAENLVNKQNNIAKTVKTLFPFLGMGLRTGREALFMGIPGFSLLSRTTRAKMGFGTPGNRGALGPALAVETDSRVTSAMRAHYLVGPAAAMGTAVAVWVLNQQAEDEDEAIFVGDPGAFRIKGVSSRFGETDQGITVEVDGKEMNFNVSEMLTPYAAFALTTSLLDYVSDPARSTDERNMALDAAHVLSITSNAVFGQQSVVRGLQSNLKLFDQTGNFGEQLGKWALSKGSAYAPANPFLRSIKTVNDEENMRGSAKLDLWNNTGEALRENFYNLAAIGEWNVGNKRRSPTGHLLPNLGRGISPLSNQAEAYGSKRYLEELKLQYGVDLASDKIMVPGTEVDLSLIYLDSGQSVADAIAESLITLKWENTPGGTEYTLDEALVREFEDVSSDTNEAHRALVVAAEAGEDPFTQDNVGADALVRPEAVLRQVVTAYRKEAYNRFMADLKANDAATYKRIEDTVEERRSGAVFGGFTTNQRAEAEAFVFTGERLR